MPADTRQTALSLIVTGLSGAGMSSALKNLEDLGYEVFDNFPLSLVDALIADPNRGDRPIAIGIDTRSRGFTPAALTEKARAINARLVFITADEAALQKRFSETRRRHPLAGDRPASAGIAKEIELLQGLQDKADMVIDTTGLTLRELKRLLQRQCVGVDTKLRVSLISFGYKHGLPRDADIVLDIRFIRNPHWVDALRPLTGLDDAVQAYVQTDDAFAPFLDHIRALIEPLLPRYTQEGKTYLNIAIGCTGGRHRSVSCVEALRPWLEAQDVHAHIFHRDIER